jgi:hypothetical protein
MLNRNKIFALSLLFSSFSAYAVAPISNNNLNVTVPYLTPGFEFNIAALWLKPGASNLNYAIYNKELPAQSPSWQEREIKPSYHGAFELGIRYLFASTGNDLKLDWTHLDESSSASIVAPDDSYFIGPDYEIGPDATDIRAATGKASFKYDVVNLTAGQYVDFGPHVSMRLFGGLSGGSLRETVEATYTGVREGAFAGPFSMNQKVNSKFTGIGPSVGVDVDYHFCCDKNEGFGLIGEASVSGLIGSMHSKTSYVGSAVELSTVFGQATNYQTIKDQNVYQVIPGFSAKLGVDYKHKFQNDLLLTVSAGYQAAVYINAISQYIPDSLVQEVVGGEEVDTSLDTGGIFVATMAHTLSNYSVQGPFLNFDLRL